MPMNAYKVGDRLQMNNVVSFQCDPGYTLQVKESLPRLKPNQIHITVLNWKRRTFVFEASKASAFIGLDWIKPGRAGPTQTK